MTERIDQLTEVLERLYTKYNRPGFIPPDPLQFLYKYSDSGDREIAGFLSAALAYGRVGQIERSLTDLFSRMGESPYAFVKNFGKAEQERLNGFKHRFTAGRDIADLLELLRDVLDEKGTIENYFLCGYGEKDENTIRALSKFCDSLLDRYVKRSRGGVRKGVQYLLPRPAAGSACKRLNLFLRWMVRKDEVDSGLWESVDRAKLIVPMDVHMSRLCRLVGLYNRKTVSLATAVEITQGFAEIEPADPAKYDFALSRIGILDGCNGRYRPGCEDCELFGFCCGR